MKQARHILLTAALQLCCLAASAQTKVEIDGIWYNLYSETEQAEVTYTGSSDDENWNEYSGSITIPATVTHEGMEYSVTRIGDYAFEGCYDLTDITIPESVTSIGEWAFYNCSSLTTLTIPDNSQLMNIGAYAFARAYHLTEINIPQSVTSIKRNTFSNCRRLSNVTIPEGVTSIGEYAFASCESLTSINIPNKVNIIESQAFARCKDLCDIYCYATSIPLTNDDVFKDSPFKNITLHVPASVLNDYKSIVPWSSFGSIVALTDEETSIENSELNIENSELIYDLLGRCVEKAEKGFYIIGGKKVMIK